MEIDNPTDTPLQRDAKLFGADKIDERFRQPYLQFARFVVSFPVMMLIMWLLRPASAIVPNDGNQLPYMLLSHKHDKTVALVSSDLDILRSFDSVSTGEGTN